MCSCFLGARPVIDTKEDKVPKYAIKDKSGKSKYPLSSFVLSQWNGNTYVCLFVCLCVQHSFHILFDMGLTTSWAEMDQQSGAWDACTYDVCTSITL